MTTQEAEQEIARLNKIIAENNNAPKIPERLVYHDFTPLVKLAEDYISELERDGYPDENASQWFFETSMEIVYGKDVWKWINYKTA